MTCVEGMTVKVAGVLSFTITTCRLCVRDWLGVLCDFQAKFCLALFIFGRL